jgi:hypothetical protein
MLFATPIWLLALIPWAALATWMLWGRREQVGVPFLALWHAADARPTTRRAARPPPLPIVLLLLATLLAILAAGSPTLSAPATPAITVILDRGITMSARDGDAYRYVRAAREVADAIERSGIIFVQPVPGTEQITDRQRLSAVAESAPPTALDTAGDVKQAVLRALSVRNGLVVVVTDQPLGLDDPRVVIVSPVPVPPNIGIAHVAARELPRGQVMVRLHADASRKVVVVVTSDGQRAEQTVDAPGTAFIDMLRLGKTIEVSLATNDALTADDRAWLVRETGWPRIEPIATLPAELTRVVDAYRKLRPSREDARVVSIVHAANGGGEAVILAPATSAAAGAVHIVDHPVIANVVWAEVLREARVGDAPPAGFAPVVAIGNRAVVAVREDPRQVWVAVDAPTFAQRADYVIFWTNVFDWLGQGGDAFVARPVGLLGGGWRRLTDGPTGAEPGLWPGLYERGDGTLRAVNASPPKMSGHQPIAPDWRPRLARLPSAGTGRRTLSPYLLLAALACALGAALLWPARKPA